MIYYQPSIDTREDVLLKGAAAFKSSFSNQEKSDALDRLIRGLENIQPGDKRLLPLLTTLVRETNGDIQVFTALAIGRMGINAVDAIPVLEEILFKNVINGSAGAVASALGGIPCKRSAEILFKAVVELNPLPSLVLPALGRLGSFSEEYIPVLRERMLKSDNSYDRYQYKKAIGSIYDNIKYEKIREFQENPSIFKVPLAPSGEYAGDTPATFFAKFSETLEDNETGLLVKKRFVYDTNHFLGIIGDCGLRIYRREDNSIVIVLSHDDTAVGPSIINNYESVATAVHHIYGLDNSNTTWVARVSGYQTVTSQEYAMLINMKFDGNLELYERGSFYDKKPANELLGELGIEW